MAVGVVRSLSLTWTLHRMCNDVAHSEYELFMHTWCFLSFKPFWLLTLSNLKNVCDIWSYFLYLAAIKESLHIDYDALWKEAEEIQTADKLRPDDLKLKSKKRTKGYEGKRKPELTGVELSKNLTSEEVPVTVEQRSRYA